MKNANDKSTGNIYLDAIEIGIDHIKDGISYIDMLTALQQKGWADLLSTSFNANYFMYWFYENFYCLEITPLLKNGRNPPIMPQEIIGQHRKKLILTGEAYAMYLSDIESKDSKSLAKAANRLSTIALCTTIGLGLIGIVTGTIQINQGQKQIKQGDIQIDLSRKSLSPSLPDSTNLNPPSNNTNNHKHEPDKNKADSNNKPQKNSVVSPVPQSGITPTQR